MPKVTVTVPPVATMAVPTLNTASPIGALVHLHWEWRPPLLLATVICMSLSFSVEKLSNEPFSDWLRHGRGGGQ